MYDLIIIGASAAGLAGSVYAARRNLNFKIITKNVGGEVALSGEVANWPGIIKIDGYELAKKFEEHARANNVEIEEGIWVEKIEPKENYYVIKVKKGEKEEEIETKTVIIASGIHPRPLGVKGEEGMRGKGVTYCTVCDGPLFKGKTTATIGGGNAGLESALMMSGIAEKVYLITNKPNTEENKGGFPKGEDILIEKVKSAKNVEIIYNATTKEVLGDKMVTGLKYEDNDTKEEKEIKVQGIMVHIGMVPNSDFVDCVEKDEYKQIKVGMKSETSAPGIFAAGDVTDIPYKQIAIASGQGVTAVLAAIEYLNRTKHK